MKSDPPAEYRITEFLKREMFLQDMCRDLTFLKSLFNKVRYQIFIKFLNIYIDVFR